MLFEEINNNTIPALAKKMETLKYLTNKYDHKT